MIDETNNGHRLVRVDEDTVINTAAYSSFERDQDTHSVIAYPLDQGYLVSWPDLWGKIWKQLTNGVPPHIRGNGDDS